MDQQGQLIVINRAQKVNKDVLFLEKKLYASLKYVGIDTIDFYGIEKKMNI